MWQHLTTGIREVFVYSFQQGHRHVVTEVASQDMQTESCSRHRFVEDVFIRHVWKLQTFCLLLKMQMFKMKQITESEVSCLVLKWKDWTWHMESWSHQPSHAQCLPRPAKASSKQKTLSYNYFIRSNKSEQRCCLNKKSSKALAFGCLQQGQEWHGRKRET